jgi:hypothetical protein
MSDERCECGLLTLYREQADELAAARAFADELDTIERICRDALAGVDGAKPWKGPANLVRQVIEAWRAGATPGEETDDAN